MQHTAYYSSFGLDQTVRVGLTREPAWGGLGVPTGVTRGVEVPHDAVNLRGKHEGDRFVASPPRVHRARRFAPSGIPAGVDQSITLPHDCANHLSDVEAANLGYR